MPSRKNLTNIWLKRIIPRSRGLDFSAWRPLLLDHRKLIRRCRIRLHHNSGTSDHVTECTVAEAIRQYISPGKCILPKELPVTIRDIVTHLGGGYSSNESSEPYRAAISDYVLVNLETGKSLNPRKRGPQIVLLGLLQGRNAHGRIMNTLYQALKAGKTITLAISTGYPLEVKEDEVKDDTAYSQQPFVTQKLATISPPERSSNVIQKSEVSEDDQEAVLDQKQDQQYQAEHKITSRDDSELTQQAQLLLEEMHLHGEELENSVSTQNETNLSGNVDVVKLPQLQGQRSSIDCNPSEHDMRPTLAQSCTEFSTQDLAIDTGDDHVHATQQQANAIEIEDIRSRTEGKTTETSPETSDNPEVDVSAPEPLQPLISKTESNFQQTSDTSGLSGWASINMPHLWPEVVQACMPRGSRIAMRPHINGAQIQFVLAPPANLAIKGLIHDAALRDSDRWL